MATKKQNEVGKFDGLVNLSDEELVEFVREIRKRFEGKPIPQKEYLTNKQLCELLNVCRSTLWRWEKEGVVKPIRIRGRVMFARSDIDKMMKKGGAQ